MQPSKTSINIFPIPILKDNYVWVIADTKENAACIVDPGEARPVSDFLQKHKMILKGILITHHHWDHTNGIVELKNEYDVPIIGPAQENITGVTLPVHEQDTVNVANFPLAFQVMAIPGHTLGHIAYYAHEMLFCGDTLFASGCGRIFEGTPEQMYASLQRIASLPNDTKIYCAHEYTLNNLRFAETVEPNNYQIAERIKRVNEIRKKNLPSLPSLLAEEKETNPFLRCNSQELIETVEKHAHATLSGPVAVFASLRKWKDGFL